MTIKDFIICFLWLFLGLALFYSGVILTLSFNLFSWNPDYKAEEVILATVVLVFIFCSFILAKFTRSKIQVWFSLLVSLVLLVFAFFVLYDFYTESVTKGFLRRSRLSPHWFRLSIFLIYLTPVISWLVYPYKNREQLFFHDKME